MTDQKRHSEHTFTVSIIGGALAGLIAALAALYLFGVFKNGQSTPVRLSSLAMTVEEASTIDVVEFANPAVVSISISKDISRLNNFDRNEFPLEVFFGSSVPDATEGAVIRQVGGGSGFVVREDGLIVTNKHVVQDETAFFSVILADGRTVPAKVLARDPILDLALIDIDVENIPALPLGDSDMLRPGQTVIAIGNALSELGNTVTRGVISGIGRTVLAATSGGRSEILDHAIQTDAAINPGNSGGPLLNLRGEVIGINAAVSNRGQSVGFAIPINSAKQTIESVLAHGRIIRPYLGVRYLPITPRLAEELELSVTVGAIISAGENGSAIIPNSPAAKVGLQDGDIILEINKELLDEKDSLAKVISRQQVGDEVKIKVLRGEEELLIHVTLEEFPVE